MTANVQPPEDIDTDWASITLRTFNLAIAVGAIEPADDEEPDPWAADMPGWRRAAAGYHRDRAGRTTIVEIKRENMTRAAAVSTFDAVMFALRRGVNELAKPDTMERCGRPRRSRRSQLFGAN
jgi:hypothetical protein